MPIKKKKKNPCSWFLVNIQRQSMLGLNCSGNISHDAVTVLHGLTVSINKLVTKTTLTPSWLHNAGNLTHCKTQPWQLQGKRCHWQPLNSSYAGYHCCHVNTLPDQSGWFSCKRYFTYLWGLKKKFHHCSGLIRVFKQEGGTSAPASCFNYSEVDSYGFATR